MIWRFEIHGISPPGHLADPARIRRERSANAPGGRWRSKWKLWQHTLVTRPTAGKTGAGHLKCSPGVALTTAPVSDRQTGARERIYRVAAFRANRDGVLPGAGWRISHTHPTP